MDIEDCDGKFNIDPSKCSGGCSKVASCPRSKSANTSSENGIDYDVCIVGAGLSGAVIAEQYASQLGKTSIIVEKRDHIGGNAEIQTFSRLVIPLRKWVLQR